MKKHFLLFTAGSLFFLNCEKPDPACFLSSPIVTVNGQTATDEPVSVTILENGNLNLSTEQYDGYSYHWTGPNSFVSDEASPVISNATNAASGEYTLTLSKGICSSETVTNISVQAITPPCTLQNNRLSFANNVIPALTFYSILGSATSGVFVLDASGSNGDLTIRFSSPTPPETGIYTVSTDCPTSFLGSSELCISIVTQNNYGYAESGTVYVTKGNDGKYSVSFCDVPLRLGSVGIFNASAKITQN